MPNKPEPLFAGKRTSCGPDHGWKSHQGAPEEGLESSRLRGKGVETWRLEEMKL
jgi:hypothetical protein